MDYVASGIGAIAGPMLAPWKASQEAKAKLIEAKAEATSMEIIAEAQAKARERLLSGKDQLHGEAQLSSNGIQQKLEFQERKRLSNVRSVIGYSAERLDDRKVDDHTPDADWTARFFDCAQDVSSDNLQRLWARLLSGEVERPGSTSLRTMDVLRNITEAEARRFQSLCSFVLQGTRFCFVIYEIDEIDQFAELSYGNLLLIQDYGLLNVGGTVFSFMEDNLLSSHDCILKVTGDRKVSIKAATLTTAGSELYRISESLLNKRYLKALTRELADEGYHLQLCPIPSPTVR